MLYDKRWDKQIDATPDLEFQGVTLRGFIAWLETKNPADEYNYCRASTCAIGQYKTSLGHKDPRVSFKGLLERDVLRGRNWLEDIVFQSPWTFGAALERARKLCGND